MSAIPQAICARFAQAGFKARHSRNCTAAGVHTGDQIVWTHDALGLAIQCDAPNDKPEVWVFGFGAKGHFVWTGCDFPTLESCARVAFAVLSGYWPITLVSFDDPFRCYAARRDVHPFDLYSCAMILSGNKEEFSAHQITAADYVPGFHFTPSRRAKFLAAHFPDYQNALPT